MQSGETREEAVCRLHVWGVSASHIRDLTSIRYQRVVEIINYYETNHSVPPPTKRGRRSIITNDILTKITALTIANRFSSCLEIQQQLINEGIKNISATTVWRCRHELDFKFKPPKIRQYLTDEQKNYRKTFAYSLFNNSIDLTKIVF